MNTTSTHPALRRLPFIIRPDAARVLVRPFLFSPDHAAEGSREHARVRRIIGAILALTQTEAHRVLEVVLVEFGERHQRIREFFQSRFERIVPYFAECNGDLEEERRLLIGSYFTSEYSLECAALFNPSIVVHPDQSDVPEGSARVVISLRATGEGHISSITFRSGVVAANGDLTSDTPSRYVTEPDVLRHSTYDRALFRRKLREIGVDNVFTNDVLNALPEHFTFQHLHERVQEQLAGDADGDCVRTADHLLYLAQSNFEVSFDPEESISERVIFPVSPSQRNGIEDARFVRFVEDDGQVMYYATYTAYDGRVMLPQMLETIDFQHFRICTLNGPAVANKGMALFPRRVNGHYCMLGRQDGENIHLLYSDHPHFWYESEIILRPTETWEFVQLGNCGSPIETDRGWLVLTHGVGAMRKYCIGAVLLDLDDPTKVVARLRDPLIKPEGHEREGYVPNVVYTCGALVHNDLLVIPYALSDSATTATVVPLNMLLDAME